MPDPLDELDAILVAGNGARRGERLQRVKVGDLSLDQASHLIVHAAKYIPVPKFAPS